jgi:Xaa-Pro aminopeptidase
MGKYKLEQSEIAKNINAIQDFMAKEDLQAFYISSFDAFLNEYVPMQDCPRFYLTGFTGSVAEVLVLKGERIKLYVDGRYHEQADLEVDASKVEVVKVPQNMGLAGSLIEDVKELAPKNIAIESTRTSLRMYQELEKLSDVKSYQDKIESIITFHNESKFQPIKHLKRELRGSDTSEKLKRIGLNKEEAYYVTAIDSVAWITNCRGYHLPHQSSFLSKALVCQDKVYLFKDASIDLDSSVKDNSAIEFYDVKEMPVKLNELASHYKLNKVNIQSAMLNASDYQILLDIFGKDKLNLNEDGLIPWQSIKEEAELKAIKDSFTRSNKAVFNTIKWVKQKLADGISISERDIYNATAKMYQAEGAVEQSFNTISGAGANGSIIHYGDPKESRLINKDDMILLDSGGYYEAGFATDKTRTFMASDIAGTEKHKEIYTLVLKGTLGLQNAIFPEGTTGAHIDAMARMPMYRHGYDFAHGTGHGVGIHVHEPGVRISSKSTVPMKAGQVVSIEPGIYIPGFGGVRLENIAYVEKHPDFEGFLRFKNLVYIGFEPLLIDESLLSEQEKIWLEDYENACKERGTSFR